MLNVPRVALYARFSSDNQRTESIDAQLRAMKQYCGQQHWQIVMTYIDEAKSATSDKRPDFQRMIADSSKGIFDIILVHKLDRFSRDRYDSAVYKSRLKKNHVSIASVLERIDDSPESIIMESMLEGMAEYYSKNLSREVMKGMRENALQGKHTGGTPPFGYDLDATNHLVINSYEAKAVKVIFEMYAEGHGYADILDWLCDNGYTTKRGTPFLKSSLVTILGNEKYNGTYVYNRSIPRKLINPKYTGKQKPEEEIIRVKDGCPAIISQELFDQVQKRRKHNKENQGSFYSKESYLVSGKVYCGICGRKYQGNLRFSGKSHARFSSYRCETHKRRCGNKELNKDYLDAYIINLLREKLYNRRSMKRHIKRLNQYILEYNAGYDEKYNALNAELETLNQSLSNITAAVEQGIITNALMERAEQLEEQRTALLIEASKLQKLNPIQLEDYLAVIEQFQVLPHDSKEFKELVQRGIDRIIAYPYHTEIVLDVGFGITDELKETITIRRGELYALFE